MLRRRSTDLPWIGHHIKKLLRRKKRLYKQARKTSNWSKYRFFQKECRRQNEENRVPVCEQSDWRGNEGNTRPFWRYVKARHQDNTGVAPPEETYYSLQWQHHQRQDPSQPVSLCLHWRRWLSAAQDGICTIPRTNWLGHQDRRVAKLLRNLNSAKAYGPNNIPSRILKECADTIAPALTDWDVSSVGLYKQDRCHRTGWPQTCLVCSRRVTGAKRRTIDRFHWCL